MTTPRGNGNGNGTNPNTTGPVMGPGTLGGVPVYSQITTIVGSSFSYNKPVNIPIIPLTGMSGVNFAGGRLTAIASLHYQRWQQNNTTCTTTTGPGGTNGGTNGTGINATRTYGQSPGASGTNFGVNVCAKWSINTSNYSARAVAMASFARQYGQNNFSIFFAGYVNF